MTEVRTPTMTIYVDRTSQQWVVRDHEGRLWSLPMTASPWEDRQPYSFDEETELEPIPGHYKYMLGIPH